MQPFFRLQGTLINFFSDYLPVPCIWVGLDAKTMSYALGPVPARTHPIYFEVEFGRVEARYRHTRRLLKPRGPLKPFVASYAGAEDLFVPVRGEGRNIQGYVMLGSFHKAAPTRAELWQRWCSLRGAPGKDDAADFLAFARTLLEVPVLKPTVVRRLGEVLSAVGEVLAGRGNADRAVTLLDRGKAELFGRELPWRMWHYAEARRDRFHRGPFQGAELATWDAEEFRLKRSPDSAITLVLRDGAADPVEALCQTARLNGACFEYCSREGGLVAGRLEEGAMILMAGSRSEARERALRASQSISRALGLRVLAAYRSYPRQPALVDRAIQEAELALRLGLARGQDLLEAQALESAHDQAAQLEALSQRLAAALAEGRREEWRLLREALCAEAVKAAGGRAEPLRIHLGWSLAPLLRLLGRRQDEPARRALAEESDEALRRASTVAELLRAMASLCDELALRYQAPAQGEVKVRLRRAAGQLLAQPEEALSLARVAKESGLSTAHFSRLFKASTGLGFAKSRLEARLAKARRLLLGSELSITAVALDCGFKNSAHFSTVFSRHAGLSPRQFRSKNKKVS